MRPAVNQAVTGDLADFGRMKNLRVLNLRECCWCLEGWADSLGPRPRSFCVSELWLPCRLKWHLPVRGFL